MSAFAFATYLCALHPSASHYNGSGDHDPGWKRGLVMCGLPQTETKMLQRPSGVFAVPPRWPSLPISSIDTQQPRIGHTIWTLPFSSRVATHRRPQKAPQTSNIWTCVSVWRCEWQRGARLAHLRSSGRTTAIPRRVVSGFHDREKHGRELKLNLAMVRC